MLQQREMDYVYITIWHKITGLRLNGSTCPCLHACRFKHNNRMNIMNNRIKHVYVLSPKLFHVPCLYDWKSWKCIAEIAECVVDRLSIEKPGSRKEITFECNNMEADFKHISSNDSYILILYETFKLLFNVTQRYKEVFVRCPVQADSCMYSYNYWFKLITQLH